MPVVDPIYAQWLQSRSRERVCEDATRKQRWGTVGVSTSRMTTLSEEADAATEGARQLAFLGGPLVIEEHLVEGTWAGRIGQVISVTGPRLGYQAGIDVFVIGAADDRATGVCRLTVLRRL